MGLCDINSDLNVKCLLCLSAKVMETLENNLLKLSNTEYSDPFLGEFALLSYILL